MTPGTPGTLADELALFDSALARGELAHALEHLARAAILGPVDPRLLRAIEIVAGRCALADAVPDDDYAGHQVLRAHGLHHAGRLDDALELLAQVATAVPDVGLERVLARWLTARRTGGAGPGQAAWNRIAALLMSVAETTIGLHRLWPGEQALLAGYAELAVACTSCAPPGPVAVVASGVLRRVGRGELAVSVAESLSDREPTQVHTQRGLALRALGDGVAAAREFAAAAELNPDTVYLIEQARSWFVAGDHGHVRALLAQLPPSDDPEVAALARACDGPVIDDPLAALDGFRRAVVAPSLAPPADATMNGLRSNRAQLGPPGQTAVSVGVAGWESPSNRLLIALYATGTGDVARANYSAESGPLPFDPAHPRRGDAPPVWSMRAGILAPVGPAPAPALRHAIADVAVGDDGLLPLWERAGALARRLDGGQAAEVARAMVHPPEHAAFLATLPEGLYRYQVAGACVIAQLPAPWSVRAPVLTSLLFGPIDWVGAAAVLAMGQLALQDAEAAHELRALLVDAVDDLLPHSCEPRAVPLAEVLARLPAVPLRARARLRAWFAATHASEHEDDDAPDPHDLNAGSERGARPARDRAPGVASPAPASVAPWLAVALVVLVVLGLLLR